jgi:hypothetical protein
MKNIYIIFVKSMIVLLFIFGVSCQNLDESPKGISTPANFYTTPAQCEAAFAAALNDLFEMWSWYENWWGLFPDGHHMDETLDYGANYGSEVWGAHFSSIKNVNLVLKAVKAGSLKGNPDDVINDIIGQAKFLRAFNYFTLVRLFGGVPYITEDTPDPVSNPLTPEDRLSIAEVYDLIEADLEYAIDNLKDESLIKPNPWTAKALLAKVYLTRATAPLNETANYAKARDMANDVIENGPYSLVPNIEDVFPTWNKNNSEMIFCFQSTTDDSRPDGIALAPDNYDGWTAGGVLDIWAASYPEQPRKNNYLLTYMYTSLDWDNKQLVGPIIYYTESIDQIPFMGKYNYPNLSLDELFGYANYNVPILRLADVMLMYAEAANMAGSGPTQLAVDRLNLIIDRANAGVGVEERADISMSQAVFDAKVIDERSYELCFEFDRVYDVFRKRLLEKVMDPATLVDYSIDDYLFPIPAFDAQFIGQNPGYDK